MSESLPTETRRSLVEQGGDISIARQCDLLGLHRSGLYYKPATESELNLQLMLFMDEEFTRRPIYGRRKFTQWLNRHEWLTDREITINPKRIRRLMQLMGIEPIYPKPHLSQKDEEHKIYPYLLRNLNIVRPNQVWATDITYIRMRHGFVYLVAILDWYSRYVLAWELSNSMHRAFCISALKAALERGTPEIFNTDQGSQFTSNDFTDVLKAADVQISMDGRGRVFDNIFTERLWRTVKYEDIYINDYVEVPELHDGLVRYFDWYDNERLHQSLNYRTPHEIHFAAAA